jgi:hypothetical protein
MHATRFPMGDFSQYRFCAERSRLVDMLSVAANSYSDSVMKLALYAGRRESLIYLALLSGSVEKRVIAEEARGRLNSTSASMDAADTSAGLALEYLIRSLLGN